MLFNFQEGRWHPSSDEHREAAEDPPHTAKPIGRSLGKQNYELSSGVARNSAWEGIWTNFTINPYLY